MDRNPYNDKSSLEFGFRQKRFVRVQAFIQKSLDEKGSCDILDLGGNETYWKLGEEFLRANKDRISVTLVNLDAKELEPKLSQVNGLFHGVKASATDPDIFRGRKFDFVHSNSVIEHVGGLSDMKMFADNVRRLGTRYYVQTPNYWFIYEPHFRLPGFQYLPVAARVSMVQRFKLGFHDAIPDREAAKALIKHHHLISTRQLREFFPDAEIRHEKFAGLNKSILAIRDH